MLVYGEPRSKERPLFANGHAYTPPKTRLAEKVISDAYVQKYPATKLEGHLQVYLEFYMGSWRRKDLDNMEKLVLDALNGLAYDDDSQVVVKTASKDVDKSITPQTRIRILEMEDDQKLDWQKIQS